MFRKLLVLALGLSLSFELSAQLAADYRDRVQTMYVAYYGRPGDEGGMDFWANKLAEVNGNLDAIIDAFGNSEEFQERFGDLGNEELVNNIFLQLLGRDADEAGLAWYVGKLEAGDFTLASIALNVADGPQGDDIAVIANKLAVANEFTQAYVAENVSYGGNEIVYAKQLIDSVDSTDASVAAALEGMDDMLGQFPSVDAIRVRLVTTAGNIVLEMYEDESPISVQNFLEYVDSGFYTDIWFHRIVEGFVIQAGLWYLDPENPQQLLFKDTNAPIVNESSNGLSNVRGSVAMARTSDPDSATSQFYINLVDNAGLDYANGTVGYAVFARVVSGMGVVDEMAAVPTTVVNNVSQNWPTLQLIILDASRLEP
jgi:cyclophilin family peptidyl-prolyl cis-trans isomerase